MTTETTSERGDFFASLVKEHERFELHLQALMTAADSLSKGEGDRAELAVISKTLDFFATDGARHEEIEEQTLFPRIRNLPAFTQILSALEFQHRMNRVEAQGLRACVDRFAPESGRELRRLAIRFVEMHRGHAVAEERALFPLAGSTLTPKELEAMSREARERAARR
jgi:hemerythrin-like domain-containing protein